MDPIDALMHEHRMIERLMNVLNESIRRVEAGAEVDVDLFEKSIDFIKNFADRCHHMKEEGELFSIFAQKGIPDEGGPIGMMLKEHHIGRDYVRGMDDGLRRYRAGDKSQAKVLTQNAKGYIDLLSQHIMKEDNILYPMGNRLLSNADRKKLSSRFEEIETVEMGGGVHEKYHHLVDDLENRIGLVQD
ncbi:MAG TPA: hemerythrin domain-containing protein [Nitrososphaerales archaeon]